MRKAFSNLLQAWNFRPKSYGTIRRISRQLSRVFAKMSLLQRMIAMPLQLFLSNRSASKSMQTTNLTI
jgi:hypothetical protein